MLCPRCGSETPQWSGRCDNCGLALIETKSVVDRHGPYRPDDVAAERYEVRERISTDPLCWTYAAFDQEEERAVSLRAIRRTILPRSLDHEAFAERFAPLLSLDIPGIAKTLRVERDEGQTIVVSELVDGLALRSMIELRRQEGRALSAVETLAVLNTIAETLEGAAAISAHGDLRPPHIVLLDETLKIEAFGLAPALPLEETVRALRDVPDASGYLAPEILEGSAADLRSDVYSLAVIATELLTGRIPPAQGGLDDFLRHLPPLVGEVLRGSLADDRSARDGSALELVEALASVLGAETWRSSAPDRKEVPSDPATPATPSDSGTIPMASPLELAREHQKKKKKKNGERKPFSKDPAVPAEPEIDGTIPMASPFDFSRSRELSKAPSEAPLLPGGLEPLRVETTSDDADATLKTAASAVEQAVAALEAEELVRDMGAPRPRTPWVQEEPTVERDPRVPVQPVASGTQQITTDMFVESIEENLETNPRARGNDDSPPPVEKDPRVPVQPAPSGTQQITSDMFVDDEGTPHLEEVDAGRRSHGLDPRLVRAARHLDESRSDEAPTKDFDAPAPSDDVEAPAPAAALDEELIQTAVQRAKPEMTPLPTEPEAVEAPFDAGSLPPLLPAVDGEETSSPPRSQPHPSRPAPGAADQASEGSEAPPSALVRGSLGPIQEKVSGGERLQESEGSETPASTQDDGKNLPAVVVDAALTEAFGPSKPPSEPTYKVSRAEALRPPSRPASDLKAPEPEAPASWWFWLLLAAMLGGTLLLVFVVGLWLLTT